MTETYAFDRLPPERRSAIAVTAVGAVMLLAGFLEWESFAMMRGDVLLFTHPLIHDSDVGDGLRQQARVVARFAHLRRTLKVIKGLTELAQAKVRAANVVEQQVQHRIVAQRLT